MDTTSSDNIKLSRHQIYYRANKDKFKIYTSKDKQCDICNMTIKSQKFLRHLRTNKHIANKVRKSEQLI